MENAKVEYYTLSTNPKKLRQCVFYVRQPSRETWKLLDYNMKPRSSILVQFLGCQFKVKKFVIYICPRKNLRILGILTSKQAIRNCSFDDSAKHFKIKCFQKRTTSWNRKRYRKNLFSGFQKTSGKCIMDMILVHMDTISNIFVWNQY